MAVSSAQATFRRLIGKAKLQDRWPRSSMVIVDIVALQRFSSELYFDVAAVARTGIGDVRVGDIIDVRQTDFLHTVQHIVECRDITPLSIE